MSFDLTNKNISDTFQNLLQKTGSEGHLYDLIGNQVDNLTIGGTLTAHSYVTSESIVNTSSGSTAFGNTVEDSHTFIGAITASGPISSSSGISRFDKIVTNRLRIMRPITSIIHSTIIDHGTRAAAGDIVFSIPGDISASGDLFTSESIIFDATDVNLYASGRELYIRSGSTSGIKMISNGSNSYLGIGTTAPTKELTVEGDISASGDLYLDGGSGNGPDLLLKKGTAGNSNIMFYTDGWANGDIDARIQTTATEDLYIQTQNDGGDIKISTTNFDAAIYIDDSATNVGIGTQTPPKTLTVQGDISASGNIFTDGQVTARNKQMMIDGDGVKYLQFREANSSVEGYIGYAENSVRINNSPLAANLVGHLVVSSSGGATTDALVGIGTENPPKMLTVAGDISASGALYVTNKEIVSGSGDILTGFHGNDEFIALTPMDFNVHNFSGNREYDAVMGGDGGYLQPGNAGALYYGMKMIPKGFTATIVHFYCDDAVSSAIEVFEGQIDDSTSVSKGTGDTNTDIDITDVVGTGTNYIIIEFNPSSTGNLIQGAKITITRT